MKPDKFNFHKKIEALKRAKVDLPNDLAQSGQVYFQRNFNKQQWDGKAWQPRITNKSKKPLLVKTGALRQSLQNSVKFKSWQKIVWGTDVPYAKYHNFGIVNGERSAHGRASFFKVKTKTFVGLKQSKKTGKYYMAHSTRTHELRGEDIGVRAHTFNLPKRQFMGINNDFIKLMRRRINLSFNKVMKAK